MSAAAVLISPGAALAVPISCGNYKDWIPQATPPGSAVRYDLSLVSSTPVFNASDSRVAVNNLDSPASVTFTSSQSRTFSISASVSLQAKLYSWLTATVSGSIQRSHTTQLGISVTAPVPPHAIVRGDYGVHAYDVTYDVRTMTATSYRANGSLVVQCEDNGTSRRTINAPTNLEGWQVSVL